MMQVIQSLVGEKNKHIEKIFSQSNFDVMNIQLKKGEEVPTHNANCDVLIIVRRGIVAFTVEEETVELTNENILYMTPLENHSLKSVEDADVIVLKFNKVE